MTHRPITLPAGLTPQPLNDQPAPPLQPTNRLTPPKPGTDEHKAWSMIHRASPGPDRWKIRSKTFAGMADAWADQFGKHAMKERAA